MTPMQNSEFRIQKTPEPILHFAFCILNDTRRQ
jgi:hypothetical protein